MQTASVLHLPRYRKGVHTRDDLFTFDRATVDSTGAFLVGELEKLDQRLHKPLLSVTWSRDIDLREDVTIADEFSSFTNSNFAAGGGVPGSNKAWIGKESNAIQGVSLDIGKTVLPLGLWGMEMSWTLPELASAEKLGRPIDQQKYEAMLMKFNMDVDEQVYVGDSTLGLTGLLNHSLLTNTGNSASGVAWDTATADNMIADVNDILNSAWKQAGYAIAPNRLLVAANKYGKLVSTKVSSAGNISVLEYLKANSLCNSINGMPLEILPLKWAVGVTAGNAQGVANADSMLAYSKAQDRVRFPLVPLARTPVEFRSIRQITTYYGRLGAVELVYPDCVARRDGI